MIVKTFSPSGERVTTSCESLFRNTIEPAQLAFFVHDVKTILRVGVALLGGLAVPSGGLLIVPRHSFAIGVHTAKDELRFGMTLLGSLAAPSGGLLIVPRHSFAIGVHTAKEELRFGMTLLGERTKLIYFHDGDRLLSG